MERKLSQRQVHVLRCIAEGLADKEIARRLRLSPHTVKAHRHEIEARLNVPNAPAAVYQGVLRGYLSAS